MIYVTENVMQLSRSLSITLLIVILCASQGITPNVAQPRKQKMHNRIVGGHVCKSNYEIMVSIRQVHTEQHKCGGTILNPIWILTAAHCDAKGDYVVIGLIPSEDLYYFKTGMKNQIVDWIPHPNYDEKTNTEDIALGHLAAEVNPAVYPSIQFVSLPGAFISGELLDVCSGPALVMGWGTTSFDNPVVERKIRCVDLPVISQSECAEAYRAINHETFITDTSVCTHTEEEKDACSGDSGGPLLCDGVQYGVVSWGTNCAQFPGVYTRTDRHLDFIWGTMSTLERRQIVSGGVAVASGRFAVLLLVVVELFV
ncbi:unnamed protein product [Phaedon cochleariae]|uniref:trypsin n=1 Tax=Phaedon cochleariae TaxID=80249 RepID=A0A9P0DH88_PHACE|nr:unnamed protein product [Phaedon cochleariae]